MNINRLLTFTMAFCSVAVTAQAQPSLPPPSSPTSYLTDYYDGGLEDSLTWDCTPPEPLLPTQSVSRRTAEIYVSPLGQILARPERLHVEPGYELHVWVLGVASIVDRLIVEAVEDTAVSSVTSEIAETVPLIEHHAAPACKLKVFLVDVIESDSRQHVQLILLDGLLRRPVGRFTVPIHRSDNEPIGGIGRIVTDFITRTETIIIALIGAIASIVAAIINAREKRLSATPSPKEERSSVASPSSLRSNGIINQARDPIAYDQSIAGLRGRTDELFDVLLESRQLISYAAAYERLFGQRARPWRNVTHATRVVDVARQSKTITVEGLAVRLDALIVAAKTKQPPKAHFKENPYSLQQWLTVFDSWPVIE